MYTDSPKDDPTHVGVLCEMWDEQLVQEVREAVSQRRPIYLCQCGVNREGVARMVNSGTRTKKTVE